jgi:branched-subunit amino acid aminotransferase/4-amino-4-deoxychorismate lyase
MTQIQTASMVWHNGTIVPKEKLDHFFDISLFMSTNLVETFFINGTEIMFLEETLARIKSLIEIYKFDSKLINDETGETFINETRRLSIRNFCYKMSRCFLLFCEGSGNNITDEFLYIEPSPSLFSDDKYLKRAIVSSKFLKPSGNVMNLPTIEHEFRKIIRSEFKQEDADDCIILNQEQYIVESYYGHIFFVDQQKVITPSANSGCSLPIMRNVIINGFKALNFQVIEMDQISVEALFEAKEVIIAGSSGIYSLKGIEYKRYFDITRKILLKKIVSGS